MALEITQTPQVGINGTRRVPKSELGKDDFLLLLTKQLQHQDPLKPVDNMEFVTQMASFSTLEQITNMGKAMENFLSRAQSNYKIEAMSFLGKKVTAKPANLPEPVSGTISSVKFENGEAIFKIGEDEFKLEEILAIETPAAQV